MTLSELADGLKVTAEQESRGVAVVDDTDAPLVDRLAPFADDLPCTVAAAATLVERYAGGRSLGDAARDAALAPVTGAKVLHLLGEPIGPLGSTGRDVVNDWLEGRVSRADALELAGCDDAEFALAVYVATHEPLSGANEALEGALAVDPADPLSEARPDADEFL